MLTVHQAWDGGRCQVQHCMRSTRWHAGDVDPERCWVITVAVEGGAHGGPVTEAFQEAFLVRDMAGGGRMRQWNSVLPMRCAVLTDDHQCCPV